MKLNVGLKENVKPIIFESKKDLTRKLILNSTSFLDHSKVEKTLRNMMPQWTL
jgi:hypothetical protein